MAHGEVTINQAEQHQPHDVTHVEPDPGFPHRHTTVDAWCNLLHRRFQLSLGSAELVGEDRVRQMQAGKEQHDRSTGSNQDSRDHGSSPIRHRRRRS